MTPRRTQLSPLTEISILFKKRIIKKISYERRAYESVDEKSLSYAMSRKTTKKFRKKRVKKSWLEIFVACHKINRKIQPFINFHYCTFIKLLYFIYMCVCHAYNYIHLLIYMLLAIYIHTFLYIWYTTHVSFTLELFRRKIFHLWRIYSYYNAWMQISCVN